MTQHQDFKVVSWIFSRFFAREWWERERKVDRVQLVLPVGEHVTVYLTSGLVEGSK